MNEYWRCRCCGKRFEVVRPDAVCPKCGSRCVAYEWDEDDYETDPDETRWEEFDDDL